MSLDRRELFKRVTVAGVAGMNVLAEVGCSDIKSATTRLTGPEPAIFTPLPASGVVADLALHAARRIAFGPRPGDVSHIAAIGPKPWIEEQLADSDDMPEDPAVSWRVNGLDTQQMQRDAPDEMFSTEYEQLLKETVQAALLRAVYSRHQLRENMADFWTNHFNIYAFKSDGQAMVPVDTESVIRKNIWSFPKMLMASSRSPAMLNYLDNKLNHRGVPNENYARELLELHTLGVKSGYSLKDIQEVARCLTGWTIKTGFERGQFEYRPELHDDGRKYIPFLNLTIEPGGGEKDAETVVHTLATHPATGWFLATKLCNRFLGSAPPEVVQKGARAFVTSHGDVRALLRPILLDALFDPAYHTPILKRPLDYTVSAMRAFAADSDCGEPLQKHLAAMGQPLYQWPMPDGFPEKSSAWTGSLLPRWNFAMALSANAIDGTRVDLLAPLKAAGATDDATRVAALVATAYSARPDSPEVGKSATLVQEHIVQARAKGVTEEQALSECAGLLIAAPAFQWK